MCEQVELAAELIWTKLRFDSPNGRDPSFVSSSGHIWTWVSFLLYCLTCSLALCPDLNFALHASSTPPSVEIVTWVQIYNTYINIYEKSLEIFNYIHTYSWQSCTKVPTWMLLAIVSTYKVEFHLNVQKVEIKCSILQEIKRVCIGQKSLPLIRLNLFTITNTPSFSWLDKAYRFHCCTWSWLNETLFKFAYFLLFTSAVCYLKQLISCRTSICYIHPNLYGCTWSQYQS